MLCHWAKIFNCKNLHLTHRSTFIMNDDKQHNQLGKVNGKHLKNNSSNKFYCLRDIGVQVLTWYQIYNLRNQEVTIFRYCFHSIYFEWLPSFIFVCTKSCDSSHFDIKTFLWNASALQQPQSTMVLPNQAKRCHGMASLGILLSY